MTRALALLALVAGCGPAAPPPRKRPPPLVRAERPQIRDVEVTLNYSVDVKPIEQAELQSKVAGYVQRVLVDRGDKVTKGQLLATVRPSDLPEQVNQAREQVGQAEASFNLASENARRARELFQRGLIAKAELDNAEAQLAVAQAARGASRAGLGVVSTRLAETDIVAPFTGWVTRRYLDPGALVSPGPTAQAILQLMRVDTLRVFVDVLEKDVASIRRGLAARVTVDALPGKTFPGVVARFAPALDPATRTLQAEVVIQNPKDERGEHVLKPGMYGHVAIAVGVHPKAIVLPVDAVVTEEEARSVFIVDRAAKPAKAKRVAVKVGFDGGDWFEIASGLNGDEEVVLTGIDLISDGAAINVTGAEKAK